MYNVNLKEVPFFLKKKRLKNNKCVWIKSEYSKLIFEQNVMIIILSLVSKLIGKSRLESKFKIKSPHGKEKLIFLNILSYVNLFYAI